MAGWLSRQVAEEAWPWDQLAAYREMIGRSVGRFDVKPLGDDFRFRASASALPGVNIAQISSSPVRVERTRRMAVDETRDLTLAIFEAGTVVANQRGRELSFNGGAFLFSTHEPFVMQRAASRVTNFSVCRTDLTAAPDCIDAALMTAMPLRSEALRLLQGYACLVDASASPEARRLMASHIHDLISLAIGSTRDALELARGRGLRGARLRAIKADIAANLDGDVSPAALALRQQVTPRYIHKLFASEGTTLSHYVLDCRLKRIHRLLRDPCRAHEPISGMAYEVGFGDLSTFNRAFRRRFGATPTDIRAAAVAGVM